jgi:nucleotide-binding universal stress UspA family protein
MLIVLAVDPFRTTVAELKGAVKSLGQLKLASSSGVRLLYVSSRNESEVNLLFDRPAGKARVIDYPRDKIFELARKAGLKITPKQVVVAFEDSISLGAISRRFVKEARKLKASAAAVHFHKTGTVKRLVLGSFSSSLIAESATPVIVLK